MKSFDAEFKTPKTDGVICLAETKNAVTVKAPNGTILQFCSYRKPTLEALLDSFDFAHIQAGVEVHFGEVKKVLWTDSYLYSRAAGSSYFTGNEYPSASLIRLLKYYKREEISERHAMGAAFAIVSGIVSRGFKSYDDFKDQLDAVDLGVVAEDQKDLVEELTALFRCLGPEGPEGE